MGTFDNLIGYLPGSNYSNCGQIYKIYIFIFIFIIVYHFILRSLFNDQISSNDVFNKNILKLPLMGEVSWWPLSHFILYFIFGLIFPDCFIIAMVTGVIWEIYEVAYGLYYKNYIMKTKTDENGNIQYQEWWGGRISDIFFNLAGFLCGLFLAKYMNLKIKIPYINS